jgi:hypothetical protein
MKCGLPAHAVLANATTNAAASTGTSTRTLLKKVLLVVRLGFEVRVGSSRTCQTEDPVFEGESWPRAGGFEAVEPFPL